MISMENNKRIGRYYHRLFDNRPAIQLHTGKQKDLDRFDRELTRYCNQQADLPQALRLLKRLRHDATVRLEDPRDRDMAVCLTHIIDTELDVLELKLNHSQYRVNIPMRLKWTGPLVALVELMYSILKYLNRGKAQIKDLAAILEFGFQVKLGNYSATLNEIRTRKRRISGFLDTLKENLKEILKKPQEK